MRFSHWLKTVASALLLSAATVPVLAQGPGGPGYGPPTFQPEYGTNDPGVLYPQGVPEGYQPYPAISPYGMGNVAWDQTFRDDDGLWFRRLMNTERQFFGSIDATYNTIKNPGSRHLGSDYIPLDPVTNGVQGFPIPTYNQGAVPGAGGSSLPGSIASIDTRVIPYPFLDPATSPPNAIIDNHRFPIRGLDAFGRYNSTGIAGRWGFFNENGSGMAINGFWTGSDQQDFTMGYDNINGVPITQEIILSQGGRLLYSRNGAIPLDWGYQLIGNGVGNLGTSKYDLLFHYDVKSSAIGTDTNFYMTPLVHRDAFKLRTLIGARYLQIDEQFSFRGIDSGFGYELVIGAGTGLLPATYRPDPASLQINYDLYEATLTNSVQTHLAGPQVGLRYDFGEGDGFKVWGQSIAGLMANQETYHQSGNNIGDEQGLLLFSTVDMLATDARFSSSRTVSHVSPLFEQTVMAEMKILEMIPIVRKLPGIDNTVFRLGYTATVVGGVARAGESIDWRGFPGFPSIKPSRDTWWMSQWNFGIEKRF